MARKKSEAPVYIQDLENKQYAQVVQEENGECFAYFVNLETGWANGSRGSISFNREDKDIKWLDEIASAEFYSQLKETREISNGMVEHS